MMRYITLLVGITLMFLSANDFKGPVDLGYNENIYDKKQIEAIRNWGLDLSLIHI